MATPLSSDRLAASHYNAVLRYLDALQDATPHGFIHDKAVWSEFVKVLRTRGELSEQLLQEPHPLRVAAERAGPPTPDVA